jgi:class 3 adenylate cyclase
VLVGFTIDLFAYVAVNGFLTAVWVLDGSGTWRGVQHIAQHPDTALAVHFWPAWPILAWGAALVLHAGVVLSVLTFGGRARRARRELARQAAAAAVQLTKKSAEHIAAKHRPAAPPQTGPRRQWVAVMFTDVADSTGLIESLGDVEWARVLGRHREFIRSSFESCGGEVVGTQGDGFLGRFATPAEAVQCAVDIQRELHQVEQSAGFPLRVRIGVHAGDAMEDDGDLIGRVVNLAARVTSAAHPGEILVTEPVADTLNGTFAVDDRGLKELRGLVQARHLLAVRWAPD